MHAKEKPNRKDSKRSVQGTLPSSRNPKHESAKQERPGLQRRRTTARTRYIDMLLGLDAVPPLHNILASLFVWVLLAGYIVFPATFNKLQSKKIEEDSNTALKAAALRTVRYVVDPSSC